MFIFILYLDTDGVDQHMTEVMENIPDMDSEFQGGVGAWDQQHAVSGRAENVYLTVIY